MRSCGKFPSTSRAILKLIDIIISYYFHLYIVWHWCFWDVRFVHKMQHELFLMAKRRHFYLANFWGTRKIWGILDDPVVIDAIIACFILPWTSDFTRGNDLLNSQYNKVSQSFSRLALFGDFSKGSPHLYFPCVIEGESQSQGSFNPFKSDQHKIYICNIYLL